MAQEIIARGDDSGEAADAAASIPDLITHGPDSSTAIKKFGDWIKKATPTLAKAVWEVISPVLSAQARSLLGLPPP
jgi:hypothetical protein